jgi:hypothetical protein
MANYLIVVPRGNLELFDLLSVAFRGHTGFNVVVDRRGAEPSVAESERRTSRATPGPDEIVVAERSDRTGGLLTGSETTRSYQRVPVRRRRIRSGGAMSRGIPHGLTSRATAF